MITIRSQIAKNIDKYVDEALAKYDAFGYETLHIYKDGTAEWNWSHNQAAREWKVFKGTNERIPSLIFDVGKGDYEECPYWYTSETIRDGIEQSLAAIDVGYFDDEEP